MNKVFIDNNTKIELRIMNHIIEIKETNYEITPPNEIYRISKNQYVNLKTGEVKRYKSDSFYPDVDNYNSCFDDEYIYYGWLFDKPDNKPKDKTNKPTDNEKPKSKPKNLTNKTRLDNPKSLSRTRKHNKDLIISNFDSIDCTQFITLLYDDHMDDKEQAKKDIDALLKKIRRRYTDTNNKMKYIYVIEYNSTGSIHFHCLLYWDKPFPQEMVDNIYSLWDKGTLHYDELEKEQDILYIAAYMTYGLAGDCTDTSEKYNIGASADEKKKIKNARLSYFNANEKFFNHSNGMKVAKREEMTFKEAVEKYGLDDSFNDGVFKKKASTYLNIEQKYKYYYKS